MLATLFPVMCFAADPEKVPEVSVVIPIYNGKAYLARALDSVCNQSFTDLEIICVDDGSTDGSLEILRQYAARDPRIVVLENVVNRGILYTRLRGFLRAKGNYIMTLDCDDEFFPKIIEKAHEVATQYDADVVHFNTKLVNDRGREMRMHRKKRPILHISDDQRMTDIFLNSRNVFLWDKMFARDPLVATAQYLFPWANQNHIVYSEDSVVLAFTARNIKKYIGIETLGCIHNTSSGVTARVRQNALKSLRISSDHRRVYLKMVLDTIELGDPAYAARLLHRFPAPFYEHIATLPLREGVDLFSKYIGPMPPKMRLKAAHKMRCTSPLWRRNIRRLARAVRNEIRAGTWVGKSRAI